jgi:hypothetical protein
VVLTVSCLPVQAIVLVVECCCLERGLILARLVFPSALASAQVVRLVFAVRLESSRWP